MEDRTYARLEFDKVCRRLAEHAGSPLGRELALQLKPSRDIDTVLARQAETTQARELMRFEPGAEFGGWHDIRGEIERLQRNALLTAEELFAVGETLAASRRIKGFLTERKDRYPALAEIARGLVDLPEIERAILSAVLPGGEIADNATPQLARIRRSMSSAQARVKERLNSIIRSPEKQKYLQEPIYTIRGDRYVVPVKQEYKGQIPGIVHDQSASGATLFIEPMGVVEANNEVRRLMAEEKQEIQRILTDLSSMAAGVAEELGYCLHSLGHLDFVLAKARYSRRLDAWQPKIIKDTKINIKKARHPLLTGKVVPVDIQLGEDFNTLVITGPNTGGKTVTLKTVGLMVLMTQAGLHIPAEGSSEMGIFNQVFADIGDEQSIEQSLSTFSSHMSSIINIINRAGAGSLVLLDELGSGTDPTEGAALAQAILHYLHSNNVCTIATTHYSELKNFAYAHRGVENASVEFDSETLQPTYRLLIGKPGRSNAFEIAARLGLPKELVEKARGYMTEEQIQVADLMEQLERTQQQAEAERRQAQKLRQESEELKQRYKKLEQQLTSRKEDILEKAREEARSIIKKAREESEAVIKELREKLARQSAREREEAIKKARENLYNLQDKTVNKRIKKAARQHQPPAKLQPGDEVFLPRYNQKGYVLEIGDNNQVLVQAGILKITVPRDELQPVKESKGETGKTQVGSLIMNKAREIKSSLDMRGMTAEEALLAMEKYLDDAYLSGLKQVNLIHGKGTGALRAAVQRELKGHPRVKKYRLGEAGEGGAGVTVVELK
ncbi:DNA mismatch repair protein MutS2 [Desulfohalotomaculum tongense]|uniref:endonuclease MutS2 n=1 Tax=Desulforadius tongensis TaxID=1216062 RepID=UPI00195F06C8|nr:endonuclease MutS2 [Desulforadius tongensis]MBM7854789.1 DNA mismatch repair protein MutS2 [Desulforadius tongensis]